MFGLNLKESRLDPTIPSAPSNPISPPPPAAKVTLDPRTAHPQLSVSDDGTTVRWEDAADPAPPRGPDPDPCVLGLPGVTSGTSCWDVEVTPGGSWAVGVAKGTAAEGPAHPGVALWSVGLCHGRFWAVAPHGRVPLSPAGVPARVRVSLDYDGGRVAFFDAEKRALIFAFPPASFGGDSVRPWFLVWGEGSRLSLLP